MSRALPPPSRCSCCGAAISGDQLAALPVVGTQVWPWGEVHRLVNHGCGSTLAIVLDVGEAEAVAA